MVAGKYVQNAATPTSAVEWVSWSITNGTVTVCIHVPVLEINPAAQKVVNSRERNAASAPGASAGSSVTAANLSRPVLSEHVFVYPGRGGRAPAVPVRLRPTGAAQWARRLPARARAGRVGRRPPRLARRRRRAARRAGRDGPVALRPSADVRPRARRPAPPSLVL